MHTSTITAHSCSLGWLLVVLAAPALAQSPPRVDYPLPPGSDIRPLEVGPAQPAEESPDGAATADADLPDFEEVQKARDLLDELLRAYQTGNVGGIQRRLDPAMVGYQVFLDGVRRDVSALKNLRINLTDTQITVGPDVAVIQTNWEKRFVSVTDFRSGIHTGRSVILLHSGADGWRLAAVARDNLFASASGTLARFTVVPMIVGVTAFDGTVPMRIEVVDPDMTGLPSVRIKVTGSDGDRETLLLPAVSPGVFRILSIEGFVVFDGALPNNQFVELSGTPGTLTFSYVDANPGENRASSTLTRMVLVR